MTAPLGTLGVICWPPFRVLSSRSLIVRHTFIVLESLSFIHKPFLHISILLRCSVAETIGSSNAVSMECNEIKFGVANGWTHTTSRGPVHALPARCCSVGCSCWL
jgi:hypothetical protein